MMDSPTSPSQSAQPLPAPAGSDVASEELGQAQQEQEARRQQEQAQQQQQAPTQESVVALPQMVTLPLKASNIQIVSPDFQYGATQHAQFSQDGYCICPNFLTPIGLRYLQSRADHIWRNKSPFTQEAWLMNLHQVLPRDDNWMWELATHPTVLNVIERHLGFVHGTTLFCTV